MKKIIILLCGFLFLFEVQLDAQDEYQFIKTTYPFSTKGSETLYLDRYVSPQNSGEIDSPCVIFMFGGAFARGSRDVPKYMPYFEYLVKNGYTVISIDYRLGLKDAAQQPGLSEDQFAGYFVNSVDMAVEDLFDATRFIIDRADEWNIDTGCIVINGSSAGAVTVLQAEYALCNGTYNVKEKLPSDFRYAGVIAFAGAIFVPSGELVWFKAPSPIMMFHGDADLQVPYDRLIHGPMGFYGAKSIAETLDKNNYPYYFYHFENYGHEIASDPMRDNKEDILWFLTTFIKEGKPYKIYKDQKEIGRPEVDKNFGFQDYVKGNFER